MPPLSPRRCLAALVVTSLFAWTGGAFALEVGFAKADITPKIDGPTPVFLAGFGKNRKATGVHDPLWARAVVLKDGASKLAFVSVDLVGFMYPNTVNVRTKLGEGYAYVMVSSTHNHEGPDSIGLWGETELKSGVDPSYMSKVEDQVVAAIREAASNVIEVEASYGTAEDETLLSDSRMPKVRDGVLRVLKFVESKTKKPAGILVQWNCHPENLGSRNTLLTADFPYYTIKALEKSQGVPVAYFTGAIGGLMSAPEERFPKAEGGFYRDGDFEFSRVYGEAVATLTETALSQSEPIQLAPFAISAKRVGLPLENPLYRLARTIGVLDRTAYAWTGDPNTLGPKVEGRLSVGALGFDTEVAYLRLGDLHVATIPGELYPELVAGKFQEPADPNADFPTAALEPTVLGLLPGKKVLILGLANDEIGYIIPKRQWDSTSPFAYKREKMQYGEINSVGPEVAPILMEGLKQAVAKLAKLPR